ncbi:PREDICTED: fibrinogen C domain-containing protein 1-like [Branchiostoma belcheri]|uniref:Fibrinogen C domain-containing protein 1-like n=1 Tax=Branchiostoma belcheri TaxID=7741 RepID=A0A6P4XSU8_BRABE|nr:PREDICTED: fibrinogen C domain-containing protein 1-like [Branchiostoma belcheri]
MMERQFLLYMVFLTIPLLTIQTCPDGYNEVDGRCFFISDVERSYENAKYDCMYRGGSLVVIDNAEDREDAMEGSSGPVPYWISPESEDVDFYSDVQDENCYICEAPPETCKDCKDCKEILDNSATTPSGVYMIYPADNLGGFQVYCDMDTDGGGWTVFQKRQDGSVDFYRVWEDYKTGFPSDLNGEFWLGNDKLHRLTEQKAYGLRVDMEDTAGDTAYAAYSSFSIADESDRYRITVGGYSGTAGDSLAYQNGMGFSTKDNDNYPYNCAQTYKGAWWYRGCHHSNLNGQYLLGFHESFADGVNWKAWKQYHDSLKRTEMKIRPV